MLAKDSENNKKKKIQEQVWKQRLNSPNQEVIIDTVKEIRDYGNVRILPEIIEKYANENNNLIKKELAKFLIDIKHKSAREIIFSYIMNDDYKHIRKDLLSFLWQSRLDYSKYLNELVDLFLSEPFDTAFEVFTVIEYLSLTKHKEIIEKSIYKLKQSLEIIDEKKKILLIDLVDLLKRWI